MLRGGWGSRGVYHVAHVVVMQVVVVMVVVEGVGIAELVGGAGRRDGGCR